MSKHIQIVDVKSSESETSAKNIHWEECVIFQDRTREDLQCPAEKYWTWLTYIGAGYKSFDIIIHRCCAMNMFPSKINLELLNEGSSIADTLQKNRAKRHKSCINKFSDLKIYLQEKAKKRKTSLLRSSFGNTVVPRYIAPHYIATLAYRHEIVKNEFPPMLIPPL